MGGILSREMILEMMLSSPPLVAGLRSPDEQVQPCGVDLTVRSVGTFSGAGSLGRAQEDRLLPEVGPLPVDAEDCWQLAPGAYQVMFNEVVSLPKHLAALGLPRSSLLRSGVELHTALWDAGYQGRSVSLLVVYNPHGFRLQRNARILQLVFVELAKPAKDGYNGVFSQENLGL